MLFLVPSRYLILLGFPTDRHAPGSAPRCACPRNHGRYVIFQMAEVAVPRELLPGHSTGHCRTAPTAGCDARREAVDHSVFESKRQETCALMAEKVEVCGTDCCKSATPARNDLAVPRFAHDSHCQCGQGSILLLRRHVIWGMSVKTAF